MIQLLIRSAAVAGVVLLIGEVPVSPPADDHSLVAKQATCSRLHAIHELELYRRTNGSHVFTDGEAWRPVETARMYAARGDGISNSLHTKRLARDRNLFIDGKLATTKAEYKLAGDIWKEVGKAANIDVAWGGDFTSVDSPHFSCPHGGVK
jgi:D-alanyl-D-alanine carboxypeptidase